MMDEDIRGKFRQPWETMDEYCSRVDREVREAGEVRYPLAGTILVYLIYILIAGVIGYLLWRYFH